MRRVAGCLVILLTAACYRWQPVTEAAPASGERVNVQLSDQGTAEMASQLGPGVSTVEGDVVEADSLDLRLAVRQIESTRGIPSSWRGEGVSIPRPLVVQLSQRKFSPTSTALAGGLALGALYSLYRLLGGPGVFEGGSGTGSGGGR